MSVAVLRVRTIEGQTRETRHIRLSCSHGDTDGYYANSPGGFALNDAMVTRAVLLRHHAEQGCGCVRKLWREVFGCQWPEVPLVRSGAA